MTMRSHYDVYEMYFGIYSSLCYSNTTGFYPPLEFLSKFTIILLALARVVVVNRIARARFRSPSLLSSLYLSFTRAASARLSNHLAP
jgi:hypothetical protein